MKYLRRLPLVALLVLVSGCGGARAVAPALQGGGDFIRPQVLQGGANPKNWTRFSPNTYSQSYSGIVLGPDKNMWFVDTGGPGLVKMAMNGSTTEYRLPASGSTINPTWIANGPNRQFFIVGRGNSGGPSVEFVKLNGTAKSYTLPTGQSFGANIAAGPDGNAWVALFGGIVRMSSSGVSQEYSYPGGVFQSYDGWIVSGPGGKLWYTDGQTESIGSIDPSTGAITEYPVGQSCILSALIAPSDGNLWFGCEISTGSSIIRMTPSGATTSYALPYEIVFLNDVTIGPGRNSIYFAETPQFVQSQPGLLSVNIATGKITAIASPYGADNPERVAAGPDGNLWMTTQNGHVEVNIRKVLTVSPSSLNFPSSQLQITITGKEVGNPLSASSSNVGIATVAPGQNANTFVVTSQAVGYCTITVQDKIGNSFGVSVTVQ